ncbi:hypothetical protein J2Y66_002779 [Paenarthrobacter nitroguajacolicus]|nr:hypothetical protein [Paenarthrobacter nitroguajacolicus]
MQPTTHRLKTRQAAAIAVVLFGPRPACMTARAPVRPPVPPTLGRDGGTQHAATVTVRTRVDHAGAAGSPASRRERECPAPQGAERGIDGEKTRLLLRRPGRPSGARRCP